MNTRQEDPVTSVTSNVYTIDVDSPVSKRVLSIVKQRQEPIGEEVLKKFKCDYCEKKFSKEQINDHILTHFAKPKKYICEECDFKFETQKELKNHQKLGKMKFFSKNDEIKQSFEKCKTSSKTLEKLQNFEK